MKGKKRNTDKEKHMKEKNLGKGGIRKYLQLYIEEVKNRSEQYERKRTKRRSMWRKISLRGRG